MSPLIHPRPLEPLVNQNSFRKRTYASESIPTFLEAKVRLPVPILPDQPEWVEMYWRAWEIAWSKLQRPKAGSSLVNNFIGSAAGDSIFMWESTFMVQLGYYGRQIFDFMGTLNNFYARQHEDGFICREISTVDGQDRYYPFDPNGTGPNTLAWAEWRTFRATGDETRLEQVFWPLMALHRWFRAHRTWPNGLYWATGVSSAMDNQPRVPDSKYHHRHWSWVDASMQAALNCRILEQMATLLHEAELALELSQEHTKLVRLINEQMWGSETHFYFDVDANGRLSPIKSIGAYWGLLDQGLVPEKRLPPFVQQLRESWAFKLPHRIPSQSADSEGYNAQTGHYWRGAVWPSTNFMVLKGLQAIGQNGLAHEIAINHLQNVWQVYQRTDTFWENYAPETAAPGEPARPDFVGWSGLSPIAILLEDVIGISVDWPLRRVTWDRRLDTAGLYGACSYPLGDEGTLDLLGDREKVFITTDVPCTITICDREQSLQAAVTVGTTEIDLT